MTDPLYEPERPLAPPRYIDSITEELGGLAKAFEDIQDSRKRADQRGQPELADDLKTIENRLSRQLGRTLRSHALWPFLEPLKGVSGPLTARLVSMIQDPLRFPGQPCTAGHILRPILPAGTPCPVALAEPPNEPDGRGGEGDSSGTDVDEAEPVLRRVGAGPSSPTGETSCASGKETACGGVLLPPRTTTGVSSLWHYLGLHATPEGKLPQRRKNVKADWKPAGRTICLQPDGLADQIVRHRTPGYRDIYDEKKASKLLAEYPTWRAHKIARIVAVKSFVGDLLVYWKEVAS